MFSNRCGASWLPWKLKQNPFLGSLCVLPLAPLFGREESKAVPEGRHQAVAVQGEAGPDHAGKLAASCEEKEEELCHACPVCRHFLRLLEAQKGTSQTNESVQEGAIIDHASPLTLSPYGTRPSAPPFSEESEGLWNLLEESLPDKGATSQEAGRLWEIQEGVKLSSALEAWCHQIGWKLIWQANCDYSMAAPIRISGSFEGAVQSLMDAYADAEKPLRADLYPNQSILVISNF